jgi:hypothetical protein
MYSYYYEDFYYKYEKSKERFEREFIGESFVSEEEFIDNYYNRKEND